MEERNHYEKGYHGLTYFASEDFDFYYQFFHVEFIFYLSICVNFGLLNQTFTRLILVPSNYLTTKWNASIHVAFTASRVCMFTETVLYHPL